MSMIKFLVAALAVAPFTLSNHYEQSAFVAGHGQYNVHERALTQVVTAVLAESFGQSEIYSARPVTDSFEQTRMHTVPTT